MAEIRAIQNGNWADASTWDLNRVPNVEDDVYIGDYTVNTLSITQITVKTIYFTGIGGLIGNNNVTKTLTCDIIADGANPTNNICMYPEYNGSLTLIGNVTLNLVNELQMLTHQTGNFIGMGNFTSYSGCLYVEYRKLDWTGNMYLYNKGRVSAQSVMYVFQLNGILYVAENSSVSYVMGGLHPQNFPRYIASIESYAAKPLFYSLPTTNAFPFTFGDIKLYNAPYLSENSAVGSIVVEGELYMPNGTLNKDVYRTTEQTFKGKVTTRQYGAGFSECIITDVNTEFINLNPNANTLLLTKQQYGDMLPQESDVKEGVQYGAGVIKTGTYETDYPQESTVLKGVEYGDNQKGTLEVIALSGATAQSENIAVVNLTEQEVERVKNCATVNTVQQCFENFKEE